MRWGPDSWLVTDAYSQEWRFWIAPFEERSGEPIFRWDLPEDPLFHLVYHAFDDSRARVDHIARDLIAIYDVLTGSRLGDALPRPTRDPQRRLRGFNATLSEVLYRAIEAGVLKFERYEEAPWPFPDVEEKKEERPPEEPPVEGSDIVELQLVSQDDLPIPEADFIVHFADGSQRRGRLDRKGEAILRNTPKGAFEVEYLNADQIRARALAARAHQAIVQGDIPSILGVAGQSSTLLKMIDAAYAAYFGGTALADDVKAAVAGNESEAVALHLLHVGQLAADSEATVVAMAQPNLAAPATDTKDPSTDPTDEAYA